MVVEVIVYHRRPNHHAKGYAKEHEGTESGQADLLFEKDEHLHHPKVEK